MAEKTGVEIELTAEDKVSEKVEKLGKDMKESINPMNAVMAGLNGNFAAMGQHLVKLAQQMKILHASMMQFTLYAALIAAVVKGVKALIEHFDKAAEAKEQMKFNEIESNLKNMKEEAAEFAKEMEKSRQISADQKKMFEENAKSINALTRAQLEFNKAQELALATSEEQRESIERRYKAETAAVNSGTAKEIRENERRNLEEERDRLQEELRQAEEESGYLSEQSRKATNLAMSSSKKAGGFGIWRTFRAAVGLNDNETDNAENNSGLAKRVTDEYQASIEKIEAIKRKIEENDHALKIANIKDETAETEDLAEEQRELNAQFAAFDKKIAEDEKRRQDEELAAEKARHQLWMTNKKEEQARARADLDERTKAEQEAMARLQAAQSQVARAWGWYRNKESMAAQLEEEKAEAAAQQQFEKDFTRLKDHRRDWRKAKNLSVDEEAVRRVALAREEEKAAEQAVVDTARDAHRAAESLAEIEKTLKGEE